MSQATQRPSEGEVLTVKLPKDVDHHVAKAMRINIDDKLIRQRPRQLILDLTETQFMDSSGLGLILGRARITRDLNIDYTVVNPNHATQKLLTMAGVDQLVKIQAL